jgi:hypothetical protein
MQCFPQNSIQGPIPRRLIARRKADLTCSFVSYVAWQRFSNEEFLKRDDINSKSMFSAERFKMKEITKGETIFLTEFILKASTKSSRA